MSNIARTPSHFDRVAQRAAILESAQFKAAKLRAAEHAALQEAFDTLYRSKRAALLRPPEPVEHEADYMIPAPRPIAAHAFVDHRGRNVVHYSYHPGRRLQISGGSIR